MRWRKNATDVKSRPVAVNVTVPLMADAAAGAVASGVVAPEASVSPERPAAVSAAAPAGAAGSVETSPWKPVSHASSGIMRPISWRIDAHDTSATST